MKLLLDQGAPRTAAILLRQAGFDAVHTGEIGLAESSDADILNRAREENRVVATLDADFHALLALSDARQPSVIRIRVEGLRAAEFSELLQIVGRHCAEDLQYSAMVSVTEDQIRIRRLPLA